MTLRLLFHELSPLQFSLADKLTNIHKVMSLWYLSSISGAFSLFLPGSLLFSARSLRNTAFSRENEGQPRQKTKLGQTGAQKTVDAAPYYFRLFKAPRIFLVWGGAQSERETKSCFLWLCHDPERIFCRISSLCVRCILLFFHARNR